MSEFDLVPAEYRKNAKLKAGIKFFIVMYVLVVMLIIFAKIMLNNEIQKVDIQVQQQQTDKQGFLQKQQQYDNLSGNIIDLKRRLDVLASLRGGPSAMAIFEMLERVIDKDVWIESWDFSRAGEWAEPKPESVHMGYMIVVPEGNNKKKQAWRLTTHMALKGQAIDHSSLAKFVQALLLQPEVDDVTVQKTNLRKYSSTSVVDFSLAIIINNQFKVKP